MEWFCWLLVRSCLVLRLSTKSEKPKVILSDSNMYRCDHMSLITIYTFPLISESATCRPLSHETGKRECSLCPVKGGALKPTDIETLWVHVIFAWLHRNVYFISDQTMEPATGLIKIPPDSFKKECVRGSCIKCRKCATYFHATCATRAGYHVEIGSEKGFVVLNLDNVCV